MKVLNLTDWTPKSFLALRDYSGRKFGADLAAGVTVGLVALPLSMAFAIASGAPPEAGLYTAVIAGFTISALGGSRTQIGGPTGAFVQGKDIPPYVAIFRIHGPFLFGATEKIDEIRRQLASLPPIAVLRLRNMTAIDSTGLQALQRLAEEVRGSGRTLLLCGARAQPARLMAQASFAQHVGEESICPHVSAAIERARAVHEQDLAHEVMI